MAYPSRLEADGLTTLQLSAAAGYIVTGFDLGDAATREVAENAPDADGTIDTTTFIGSRAVTMSLALSPDVDDLETMWNRLRAFTSPRVRPKLFFRFDDAGTEMMLTLRRSQWNGLLTHSRSARVTLQWIAPSGLIESSELNSADIAPGDVGTETGRSYDLTFDRTYPAITGSAGTLITNDGNAYVNPVVRMYGQCTDPVLRLGAAGGPKLEFEGMSIAAGDYIEVDFAARTVIGANGSSYYNTLDFATSEWWALPPGQSRIYFIPETNAITSKATIEWRDGWY